MIKLLKFLGMPFIILFSFKGLTKLIIWIIVIVIIITAILLLRHYIHYIGDRDAKSPETENPPQTNQQNTTVNAGKTKTLYRFADYPNGKVSVYIGSITARYPKGGDVKCKTPSGKIVTIKPGKAITRESEPPGIFTFWAGDQSAWGIEIWQ